MADSIPVAQKNMLKNEVISCIIEDQKDPEQCLMNTAKMHGLSKKQTKDLAEEISNDDDNE